MGPSSVGGRLWGQGGEEMVGGGIGGLKRRREKSGGILTGRGGGEAEVLGGEERGGGGASGVMCIGDRSKGLCYQRVWPETARGFFAPRVSLGARANYTGFCFLETHLGDHTMEK